MNSNCANDTRDGESFERKIILAEIKLISESRSHVRRGEESEDAIAAVKVALRAVIRENYRTSRSYTV